MAASGLFETFAQPKTAERNRPDGGGGYAMAEFLLDPNYVEMLGIKIRALMGKEPADEDESGSI